MNANRSETKKASAPQTNRIVALGSELDRLQAQMNTLRCRQRVLGAESKPAGQTRRTAIRP